jgi:cytochrome c5
MKLNRITAAFPAILALALSAAAFAQSLPAGDGKDEVEKICAGCHDLAPITESVGGTKADWEMVVQSMIQMGAEIKPEQVALITNYLAQNFPPRQKQ